MKLRLIKGKKSMRRIPENYKQPDWCDYPNNPQRLSGCWAMWGDDLRQRMGMALCKDCSKVKR